MNAKRTILLADDAAMFRELGSVFLARTGRVITVNNGEQSLKALQTENPSVVVADLDMPTMDGAELCRRIKADAETASVPVILMTSSEDGEERARAVRAGADDVIAKPINRIALIQAVNRLVQDQPTRGLPRVGLHTRVHIVRPREHHWGIARNVSRGGMFVEAGTPMPPSTEVSLEFTLPEFDTTFAPTAEVMWRRSAGAGHPAGMGLRFLALDRESAERIDDFVYQFTDFDTPPLVTAAGGSS